MKKSIYFLVLSILALSCNNNPNQKSKANDDLLISKSVLGIEFTQSERDSMRQGVFDMVDGYRDIRNFNLENKHAPALHFNPFPVGFQFEKEQQELQFVLPDKVEIPENRNELAFMSIAELAYLLKNQKITSEELTLLYLQRIEQYDSILHAYITVTKDLALKQAQKADTEIAAGNYRGLLHGIPYGVKDLLAVEGYKTTWGSTVHQKQILKQTATVVKKLEEAGAVLLGKQTLGALAWGDVWFGGITRNPWNTEQGSSGSSAGPASAATAGLSAFSIGSETWGSIVSPSTRCGATGLRPSYGRVSRTGAMALSWSMDKLGPICRTAQDCAIVFAAIQGADPSDKSLFPAPFNYNANSNIKDLKIAYAKSYFENDYSGKTFDEATLETFRQMGVELIPFEFPQNFPVNAMSIILNAEAAAAFDQITINGADDSLVRQVKNAWPNVFRQARFIPAVEYINANRIRSLLIDELCRLLEEVDVVITPSFQGNQLLMTNLTGHPAVVLPNGFAEDGTPVSISFIGKLYGEQHVLRAAQAYQQATDFEDKHPTAFNGTSAPAQ